MIFFIEYITEKEYVVEFKSDKLYFYTNLLYDNNIFISDLGVYESDESQQNINVNNIGKRIWKI